MARRIRWQIVIAALSALLVAGILGRLALRSASVASPLAGGTYVEAIVGAPELPIPLLNDPLADPAGRALIALLYDGLTRVGSDGLIEPALAESYEVDPSGEVYTFSLRRDISWHDGTPLTANDVVFTLRALQTLDSPGDPADRFWQDVLVDRIDDYTVRATLSAPYAAFPSLARVPILPAHLLGGTPPDRWPESAYARSLIGTGPYRLVELDGQRARLEANPAHLAGRPYLDSVELRFFASAEAAAAALARGELTAFGERGGATLAGLDLPGNLRLVSAPLDEYATLSFNLRAAPLDEQPLRAALARALDRERLLEVTLEGRAGPIDTPILPGSWAHDPSAAPAGHDRAAAERTLGELGWEPAIGGTRQREGLPLALELIVDAEPRRLAAAQEVARQWGEIGVAVEVVQLETAELLERLAARDFALAVHSWARLGPDPYPFALWHSSQAAGGLNYPGLADEQLDALLEEARAETDLAARSASYAAFQRRWLELTPAIPLFQPRYYLAADEELGGVAMGDPQSAASGLLFGPEDRYRGVGRWYTDSYREIQGDLE